MEHSAAAHEHPPEINLKELKDRALVMKIKELNKVDNWRNWIGLFREHFVLLLILAAAISFYYLRPTWGLNWAWNIPVTGFAIFLVGIWQHRLVMLGHEASHYLLFKNRKLNEVMSNWLCFYPLWGRAYNYRAQHLAHHQYTNDPELDPVLKEMALSGGKFRPGMPKRELIWQLMIKMPLWLPGLIRYSLVRARYTLLGDFPECYKMAEKPPMVLSFLNIGYVVSVLALVQVGIFTGNIWVGIAGAPVMLLGALAMVWKIPANYYPKARVPTAIPPKWDNFQRLTFITLLFVLLSSLRIVTGEPWILFYLVLWIAPLFTSFAYFMILREDIQHANAGREGLSHTRNFAGNPLVKWAVFPYNMDYHLPHHLFPSVPHYNLKKLDDLLRETEVYRTNAEVVRGYLLAH